MAFYIFEAKGDLALIRRLEKENCHFEAWLRFARMPLVTESKALDARFSSGMRLNFTELKFADFETRLCSQLIPKWGKPRSDLLKNAAQP